VLPQSVDDLLLRKAFNLVSQLGSAEYGFLLTSHRQVEHGNICVYLLTAHSSAVKFNLIDLDCLNSSYHRDGRT
jgi:hypothetical protein